MRYLVNQWMDFDLTCTDTLLGGGTSLLDFGDIDLIFKVSAISILKCSKYGFPVSPSEQMDGF